jgi:hypothetical protein
MLKKQFTLYLQNRPGELARVTSELSKAKINVEGMSAATSSDVGLVQIVVSNATRTRAVLKKTGVSYTMQDVVVVELQNAPGALAQLTAKLARSKININYLYATACACGPQCRCYAVISAPNPSRVPAVLGGVAKKR